MTKITKKEIGNGEYSFKLEEVLEHKQISKNKLMKDTETDFKVIQRIAKGTITKVDIYVLSRICDYLDCTMTDIIDYQKKKNQMRRANSFLFIC